jgi:hypothetical protein
MNTLRRINANLLTALLLGCSLIATLTACGGGGSSSGSVSSTPAPISSVPTSSAESSAVVSSEMVSSSVSSSSSMGSGQVGHIEIEGGASYIPYQAVIGTVANIALQKEFYLGTVGNEVVTFYRHTENSLVWLVPPLSEGLYSVVIELDSLQLTGAIDVVEPTSPPILNPEAYLDDKINTLLNSLDSLITELQSEPDQDEAITMVQEAYDNLREQASGLSLLSAQDKVWLAHFLSANNYEDVLSKSVDMRDLKYVYNVERCNEAIKAYIYVAAHNRYLVSSIAAAIFLSSTGVGSIAVGVVMGELYLSVKIFMKTNKNLIDACIDKDAFDMEKGRADFASHFISSNIFMAAADSAKFSFVERNPRSYHIVSTYSITNAEMLSAISSFRSALSPLFDLLPSSWVTEIKAMGVDKKTEIDDPEFYSIIEISDPNIIGETAVVGEKIQLIFKYLTASFEPSQFTFKLIDSRDNSVSSFSATLSGLELVVEPDYYFLNIGKTVLLKPFVVRGDLNKEPIPYSEVNFISSHPAVASVDNSGLVTAKTEGTSTISSTHKETGHSVSVSIKVGGCSHGEIIDGRYEVRGDNCDLIFDLATRLEWQRCAVGQTYEYQNNKCTGVAGEYTWDFARTLTATGGFRTATIGELKSIRYCSNGVYIDPTFEFGFEDSDCNSGSISPTINLDAFPMDRNPELYHGFWSSSASTQSGYAWMIYFDDGQISATLVDFGGRYQVRLVRGEL